MIYRKIRPGDLHVPSRAQFDPRPRKGLQTVPILFSGQPKRYIYIIIRSFNSSHNVFNIRKGRHYFKYWLARVAGRPSGQCWSCKTRPGVYGRLVRQSHFLQHWRLPYRHEAQGCSMKTRWLEEVVVGIKMGAISWADCRKERSARIGRVKASRIHDRGEELDPRQLGFLRPQSLHYGAGGESD